MKKALQFITKLIFFATLFLSLESAQAQADTRGQFHYEGKLYEYQITSSLTSDDRRKLTIRETEDQKTDTHNFSTVFSGSMAIKDKRQVDGSVHLEIYYAEKVNAYSWRNFPLDYLQVIFNFGDGTIVYGVVGERMKAKQSESLYKQIVYSFEAAKYTEAFAEQVAIDYLIVHYNKLFVR
jgi:hypothetical protein